MAGGSLTVLSLKQVGLTVSRANIPLLGDVSFTVNLGDRLCLVGPSGAGKTTLLRLLNRLHDPTTGTIEFNDSLNQIPITQLRQRVVLVPSEPKLLGMTGSEALAYPLKLQGLSKNEIQDRIINWTSRLGIPEDLLERYEVQLSLGQRQLIAIGRALMMNPQILLLDEPTSALDAANGEHLINVLIELSAMSQIPIIMVNHQLNLVQKFANRVLYLEQGKILEDKAASEVNWSDLYEQLKQAQQQKMLKDDF